MSADISTGLGERVALEVSDLMRLLPLKRAAAYALAKQIGVRVGRRRILIPRVRLDAWLAGESNAKAKARPTARGRA